MYSQKTTHNLITMIVYVITMSGVQYHVYHCVFVGCSDGAVYEWDIATGTCVRTLIAHSRSVNFVHVSIKTFCHYFWSTKFNSNLFINVFLKTLLQVKGNKLITSAEDCTVCVWYTRKSATMVSWSKRQPRSISLTLYMLKFHCLYLSCALACLQDDSCGLMEEDETDYVDIPIRVVTQSDNT